MHYTRSLEAALTGIKCVRDYMKCTRTPPNELDYTIIFCNRHIARFSSSPFILDCLNIKKFYFHCVARDSCTRRVVCGATVRFKISSFVAPTTRRALHNVWENARGEVCAMLLCCFPMYTGETPWFRQLFVEHYVSEFWFHLYINSIVEKKKCFFSTLPRMYEAIHLAMKIYTI